MVSHGNDSSSEHYWPAGAFGAAWPSAAKSEWDGPAAVAVGGIAPTGRTAPTSPAGITCPEFL